MDWHDNDVSGWGWFAMSISMILFWALIITVIVLLVRSLNRSSGSPSPPAGFSPPPASPPPAAPSPEQVLAERFARGEVEEEEYRRRLAALRADAPRGRT